MILVTLGTQKFPMDRLVQAMDEVAERCGEEVFIQKGHSTYEPKKCKYSDFVDATEFQKMIENCSVLVTHSGVGTIMRGINAGRPVVVVPRLAKFHEHVDDHQVQIAKAFAGKNCVLYCDDLTRITTVIEEAREYNFSPYNAPESNIQDMIFDFIHKL